MRSDLRFRKLPKSFWANVRIVSQQGGYTVPRKGQIKIHSLEDMVTIVRSIGLNTEHICGDGGKATELGSHLVDYFQYRALVLNEIVVPRLMDLKRAREVFNGLKKQLNPQCPLPMNKQKGEKATPAYLTGIVNMIIEANCSRLPCDYNPQKLPIFTRDKVPLQTLARRVDGCFPSTINPIALWEIKEYYHTTTFGSRVADGVYESLLDGFELEELNERENIEVSHLLFVDGYSTWWEKGRSYLCRLVDMLHMGYIDDILFGYEVVERLPDIVKEWVAIYGTQKLD